MSSECYVVGVDVGGTFTDIFCYGAEQKSLLLAKVPSVPGEQWNGVLKALEALGIDLATVAAFVHGTTIATNMLLEKKGAKTGVVTTKGFRDIIEIGLTRRLVGGLFDMEFTRPPALVPRELRLEVRERVAGDGAELEGVNNSDVSRVAETFRASGVEAVAVCFVNSYLTPSHEMFVGDRLRKLLPDVAISESAVLRPEKGEFGRFSTCALNAYLTPGIARYLQTLTMVLSRRGVSAPVNIMTSNGGAIGVHQAADNAVATFLSGPAGGVAGALRICEMNDVNDCITFDMGGTSTDVALIRNRSPRTSYVNQHGANPVVWPQLDIHTIGAGGGSIIAAQPDGTLEVGPQSAGAAPGPACYGRGGTVATISDADLLLGRLPSKRTISGGLRLSIDAARQAMEKVAREVGRGPSELFQLCETAVQIAVAKMAGAVLEVSVHRGYDPRDFVLIGFGGAGPMHVLLVANELYIPRVLIPPMPGHLSALGQMLADHRRDFVTAWHGQPGTRPFRDLIEVIASERRRATSELEGDGFASERQKHMVSLDMRYSGQQFTLAVPWRAEYDTWQCVIEAFSRRHRATFGHVDAKNEVQITTVRTVVLGLVGKPTLKFPVGGGEDPISETRRVWFGGAWRDCPVYDRAMMGAGFTAKGISIVEEVGCTTVVPPGWTITRLATGAIDCRASVVEREYAP